MRCFVAVDLGNSLAQKITALQDEISKYDIKLVEPNKLHFTLKFLGEIRDSDIGKIKESLSDIAQSTRAFTINLRGTGAFPSAKNARVVWVGSREQEFEDLHTKVQDALPGKKEKPAAHLTLARARSARHAAEIAAFIEKHKNIEIGAMRVEKIKLKKSTLTKKGPVYEDVAEFELVK